MASRLSRNVEDDAEADSPRKIHQHFMRVPISVILVPAYSLVQGANPFLAIEWVRVSLHLYCVLAAC